MDKYRDYINFFLKQAQNMPITCVVCGANNYRVIKQKVMTKIICNRCKNEFKYKTRHFNNDFIMERRQL